jgi:hypothetical protein
MKTEYKYCKNDCSCIHRRACARWIYNYSYLKFHETIEDKNTSYINEEKCIPNLFDINCKNDYKYLDRYRLSNGEEFKTKETNDKITKS